jgi:hypothetical protein
MSNKILIVGALACLSAVAVAQSGQSKENAPQAASQDAASAQMTGKRMHKPMTVTAEAGQETAKAKPTNKSAADDWQTPAAKTSQPKITENKPRVATGDVNGDGKADAVPPGQPSLQNTSAHPAASDVKGPRDMSTGQSSGKLMNKNKGTAVEQTETKPRQ